MPGLDRQGPPFGDGNQSGRRMGKCNPENKDTSTNPIGMGRRWRNRFDDSNEEQNDLKAFIGRGLGRGRREGQGFGRGLGRGFGRGMNPGQGRNQSSPQN